MTDNITGGKVTYEDAVKHEGYPDPQFAPSRRAAVELSFEVFEGENGKDKLDETHAIAVAKVNEMLSKKSAKEAVTATTTTATSTRKPRAKAADKSANEPATDKDKLAQAAGLPTTDLVVEKAAEPVEDSLDDIFGDEAPVPITDAELAKAAQNKNAQMKVKDPNFSVKIRALVVEYAGQPPKKITDVPVAKRQEFLDKLRDLT
jgi:hypothetical protein